MGVSCPECGKELKGSGYSYSCGSCQADYTVDFFCEKCGAKPDMETGCGAVSFYCQPCNDLKSRTTMKKEFHRTGSSGDRQG